MARKGNSRYTCVMFNEVLSLAVSLSSMYTRVALNMLRNSEFENERYHLLGLSIIAASFQSFLP